MAFLILTKPEGSKHLEIVAGYPKEKHRDTVLELMQKNRPNETFIAQNPLDEDRDESDPRRTL